MKLRVKFTFLTIGLIVTLVVLSGGLFFPEAGMKISRRIRSASGPLIRIIPIPPCPGGVAIAAMVSVLIMTVPQIAA